MCWGAKTHFVVCITSVQQVLVHTLTNWTVDAVFINPDSHNFHMPMVPTDCHFVIFAIQVSLSRERQALLTHANADTGSDIDTTPVQQ